ncbi:hypothetical protein [Kordia sp.]|uniref:hypothetical protein n=1 Tax=Kordia sp. TaxID=1965332 RepID=UPI003B5A159C
MQNLISLLQEQKAAYTGNHKDLTKLINKIDSTTHAPTSEKHIKRMVPFVKTPLLVDYVNTTLKHYFEQKNNFTKDLNGLSFYDIKETWYLFTLLVCSDKIETTVSHIIETMLASKNADLSIARRILNLCKNPVYQTQLNDIESYFEKHNKSTKVYQWMHALQVTSPTTFNWEFVFQLQASQVTTGKTEFTDNLFLSVRGFEPKGNGASFQIDLTDSNRDIYATWNDFSKENYCSFKNKKIQLSLVPNLENLKDFIKELEAVFNLEFDRTYDFQYFTRGFKNKNNIQKWLREK